MAERLLVGWFVECLECKATFIRITPENWTVEKTGRIFLKETGQKASGHNTGVIRRNLITSKRKFVGFVRCPDCLSGNVRLMEICDEK